MIKLDEYLDLRRQIFEYFGYEEGWKVISIDDCRKYYWSLDQASDDSSGAVYFADSEDELNSDDKYSCDEIFTYVHISKFTYRGPEYTMICCDTNTDGNFFLRIFDNKKERERKLEEE